MLLECAGDITPGTQIYNLADSTVLSVIERFELVADLIGWNGRILSTEELTDVPTQELAQQWVSDTSNFRRDFEYSERFSMREAFKRTIEHSKLVVGGDHD